MGVKAPKSVPVYRKELYLQIQEANVEAARAVNTAALSDLLKKEK